jgi:hypothetical protein
VAREFLRDDETAREIEIELLEHPLVKLWLKNLKPDDPPQHWSMEHGSFDFNLENALLKAVQLGLHAGLPPLVDAVRYYINKIVFPAAGLSRSNSGFQLGSENSGFYSILITNLLILAGLDDKVIQNRMLDSLNAMYGFVRKGYYDIYISDGERDNLKAVPAIWKNKKFIRRSLVDDYGFCYPLIYDIVGLHKLYGLSNPEINEKINAVIEYISSDGFHHTISDGYGILISGDRKYHAMGWDPKYPGWFNAGEYLEKENAPKLLFFAEYISNYPYARKTKWFGDLLEYMKKYRTEGDRYVFPADWLKERRGYAVTGSHISFGENRKKKNWREIESTFYMLLLNRTEYEQ